MSRLVGTVGSSGGALANARDSVLNSLPDQLKTFGFNTVHRALLGWNYTAPNTGQISLYPRILGSAVFDSINRYSPNGLGRFHTSPAGGGVTVRGSSVVTRGSNPLSHRFADLLQLPKPFANGTVTVHVHHFPDGREFWNREFAPSSDPKQVSVFATGQWMEDENTFTESEGPLRMKFRLVPVANPSSDPAHPWIGYEHQLIGLELALSPWFWSRRTVRKDLSNAQLSRTVPGPAGSDLIRIPIPQMFWPRVTASTIATVNGWKYRIVLDAPTLPLVGWSVGRILTYEGEIDSVTHVLPATALATAATGAIPTASPTPATALA